MINVERFVLLRRLCVVAAMAFAMSGVFAEEISPDVDDVAYTVVGAETKYYNSLDLLFTEITNETKVVIFKDSTLTSAVSITNAVNFYSEVPSGSKINLSKDAKFEISKGALLKVSSLEFVREKAGSAPFVVSGGNLEFGNGAGITELLMIDEGNAVQVKSGTFRMLDGSKIVNCEALSGCSGSGGAVYLDGSDSCFEFFGGTISGCSSRNSGGAVYAAKGAKVALNGSAYAFGNTAAVNANAGDLYFVETDGDPLLSIDGALTGEVGVYYSGRTALSKTFATVGASVDAADVCSKILNSADESLFASPSADGKTLVWAEAPAVDDTPKPLPDENDAEARVVTGSSIKYYAKAVDALKVAKDGERVELLKDAVLSEEVKVSASVVFDGRGFTLSRNGKFFIDVGNVYLSVTNAVFDGSGKAKRFFYVTEGGSLIFEEDTVLKNVNGNDSEFVAPVVVWGGMFTMNGGRIENCVNEYIPQPGGPLTSGAIAMSGGTAYFNGGTITECVGARAGGVCIYNGSTAYVKSDFTVLTNATPAGVVCNLVIQDLSKMIVVDDVVGKIGCYDGYLADTNIAAHVDASFAKSAAPSNLVASALRFRHDVLDVKAVPVTDGDETLFVWRTALGDDGKFTIKKDGIEKVYGQIVFPLEDPDFVPCPPFAFTAIKEAGDKTKWIMTINPAEEYCKYTLYASDDLKNWERVYDTGALAPGTVTPEGEYVFESPAVGDKRFWRAVGKDGLK
ncbi:MAG: hypothetical protein J6W10_03330 [Kiritimatiellae bacterium]|nr:hypothetical protein [Kiritimatiellia bacterium]